MTLTLAEAEKYSLDVLRKGVLKVIIKDSEIMPRLRFRDVVGNSYKYVIESALGTASFYSPNEEWTESTPTVSTATATITIMGGDADVDEFLKQTRSDHMDLEAEILEMKAKGIRNTFMDKFWYGDASTNTKEFSGVHKLVSSISGTTQTISEGSGSTGDELTLSNMDKAFDLIRDGMPELIVMTRAVRRRLTAFLRANGGLYQSTMAMWGNQVGSYNDSKVTVDDFLTQVELLASGTYSAKTGGLSSSMFFLTFGETDLIGLQNGGLVVQPIGQLETKDAKRTRIKWYPSLALLRPIRIAMIDGITDAAAEA